MEDLTPMLRQYQSLKAKHQDCILFFRLGDFYEMFYDDAQKASGLLGLVLTSRGQGRSGKIPMCGIPYHAADSYIAKLIKAGMKIAICEQTEDPALARGLVRRDVIRVITSGTFIDDNNTQNRYILCLNLNKNSVGMALTDVTHGTIEANEYADRLKILDIISKLPVYECLFPANDAETIKDIFKHPLLRAKTITLSPQEDWCFNPDIARKSLCEHFHTQTLKGFGIDQLPLAVASAGALLEYLKHVNRQPLRHIDKVRLYADSDFVFISPAAHYGLELDSLLKTLDHTLTALGKRQLQSWLYRPLKNPEAIYRRQKAVILLKEKPAIQQELNRLLRFIPDIEKSLSRLGCGYTSARDLLALRNALERLPEIQKAMEPLSQQNPFFLLDDIPRLRELLIRAINPEMPLSNPEGKIVRRGYHEELDSLRDLKEQGHQWLKNLQEQEIKRTKINSLKIGYTQVFGYFIEVTKANLAQVPPDYIRKQTLVNAERFITTPLKEFEEKILTAEERILTLENQILHHIQKEILEYSSELHTFSSQIAALDVLYSFVVLAHRPGYVAPEITEETTLDIKDGRHPVVERALGEPFVPNDTFLDCDENHLVILTGPNMAGKSTYIRQTALLTIMAQIGSFVPAKSARIGFVDKIFTRIGAYDQITKGQSTFMVEMSEAADILNNLTARSLVILDEIGRGTSTFDGLSLAWALAEYLHRQKVRTLFATHFHELTGLADEYRGVKNYNVAVKEWQEGIVFLHKIIPGGSDDSYGIYVAKLAGIPQEVISRSKQILTQLELYGNLQDKIRNRLSREVQLPLFSGTTDPVMEKIKSILQGMDVHSLTPLNALEKLYEWKEMISKNG